MATVDASNSCIPPEHPLVVLGCPVPSTVRGEPTVMDGKYKKDGQQLLVYGSGRLVIVRDLLENKANLVYRGHHGTVTAVRFAPSGSYIASGDSKGRLRVWAYDHPEHLCKLEQTVLTGPIRDISWDFESKRIVVAGERADGMSSGDCCKAIQWDTGVSCGQLGQHTRGRAVSCDFKPNRPMRIVTAGKDDSRVLFNKGPPFTRVVDGVPTEDGHAKGSVNCIRYNPSGTLVVSVGADKSVCLYDGKTMEMLSKLENVHDGSIYACAWASDGARILTCASDGTCKLFSVEPTLAVTKTINVAKLQQGASDKLPIGGMQMGCAFVQGDIPVSVGLNGQITVLNGEHDATIVTGHNAPIAGMAVAGSLLYTADTDGIVVEWDLATGSAVKRLVGGDDDLLYKTHGDATISSLTFASNKLMTAGWDDTIRMHPVTSEESIVLEAQPSAMSCGTNLVAVLTVGGIVLVQNGTKASPLIQLDGYAGLCVCLSKDDSTLYIGGEDCKIHIYKVTGNADGLEHVHVIENGHLKPVHAVQLSHDESKLASADVRDVCVWSLPDYAPLVTKGRWCFHTQRITCLAWSPNDEIVASASADDSIFLWSPSKKTKRVHYSYCHRGGITGLEFIGNIGWKMVSVGADSCVNQWDVTDDVAKKFG